MASIDTKNPTRDEDLRSAKYLDVEQFPEMAYRSVGLRELPGGVWRVFGEMTIRGVTKPGDLSVQYHGGVTDAYGNIRISFNACTSITRSDFGITHELAKEADNLLVVRKHRHRHRHRRRRRRRRRPPALTFPPPGGQN